MRAIILAGGLGTRLGFLTAQTNKHLLPIYDRPMIFYPIQTLLKAGIKDIAIVVSGNYSGQFINLLKDGKNLGLNSITYFCQNKDDGGIADALKLCEHFAGQENICVILGDNTTDANIKPEVNDFKSGAHLFLKEVDSPSQFGVVKFQDQKIVDIIEKPQDPPSNYAVTGLYLFDSKVWQYLKEINPSERGQLEITDINNLYLKDEAIDYSYLDGFWIDAGTPDNLYLANEFWYRKSKEVNGSLWTTPIDPFRILAPFELVKEIDKEKLKKDIETRLLKFFGLNYKK